MEILKSELLKNFFQLIFNLSDFPGFSTAKNVEKMIYLRLLCMKYFYTVESKGKPKKVVFREADFHWTV